MPQSVIILGGGIIGLSCAFEARRRGYLVTLVEPGKLGGQASGAAAGMLAPFTENPEQPDEFFRLCLRSHRLFPDWVRDIEDISGMPADLARSGSLNVLQHEADVLPAQSRLLWHNAWGAQAELVEGNALRELEPNLSPDAVGAVYSPEESHVYAPGLVESLAEACRRLGVTIWEGAGEFQSLQIHSSGGVTVRMGAASSTGFADRIVICSGAWSGLFERSLGIDIPIHPIRGQICSFEGGMEEVRHIVFSSQAYWVGKRIGRIVCGASEDVAGFETGITDRGIGRLLRATDRWFPLLKERESSHRWAGLRPATSDGRPLIGTVNGSECVLMAAGHYRNGILLSPATAMMIADLLDGTAGHSQDVYAAFAPERFTRRPPYLSSMRL